MRLLDLPEIYRNLYIEDASEFLEFWNTCFQAKTVEQLPQINPDWVRSNYIIGCDEYRFLPDKTITLTTPDSVRYVSALEGYVKESLTDWATNTARTVDDILEDIQIAQIEVGGRYMRRSEIASMSVQQLLEMLVPNGVRFDITAKKPEVDKEVEEYTQRRSIMDRVNVIVDTLNRM
jgi:hypothetical protein